MGMKQRACPLIETFASGQFIADTEITGGPSAKPCARDPPLRHCLRGTDAISRACGVPRRSRQGKTFPHPRSKGEAMRQTSPLPNAGLAKLVLVTASYVTR